MLGRNRLIAHLTLSMIAAGVVKRCSTSRTEIYKWESGKFVVRKT